MTNSLSHFLVTFCLQELLAGSKVSLMDQGLEKWFLASKSEATPIWTGGIYPNWDEKFSYYLVDGSVLVGEVGGGVWFAANNDQGIQFLQSRQGPIRRINISMEGSWSLDILPDGSAKLTLPNKFDSSAQTLPGTFDFLEVRDQLLAISSETIPRTNPWSVFFPRQGQKSWAGG